MTTADLDVDLQASLVTEREVEQAAPRLLEIPRVLPVPNGFCQCGCGQRTKILKESNASRGLVKGQYRRFASGHSVRARWLDHVPEYVEQDCGYTTPCWVWQRAKTNGYGSMQGVRAYQVYYIRARGMIPEGTELDHLCRNRACVNPDHLEPVSHAENVRRGAATKLTSQQVHEIRSAPRTLSNRKLAACYGVTNVQIHRIRHGASWKESA